MVKVLQIGPYGQIIEVNSPRNSKHTIIRPKGFLGRIKTIWRPLQGIATWRPLWQDYDLIHSFNEIPYTQKPWIITFESWLPRTIGIGGHQLKKIIRERLALDNCKKIIAMSDYAKIQVTRLNKDWNKLEDIYQKIEVIHPNFYIAKSEAKKYNHNKGYLQLLFVGNDFARKGGIVALRVAQKAQKIGLPIIVHIISGLNYGSQVYTDCKDIKRYEEDLKLLNLSNVVFHGKVLNQEVIRLLSESDFQIMASLHDTYGYSIIEGMIGGTPAIVTNVCALTEIIKPEKNGYMLNLEIDEYRNWIHLNRRESKEYWEVLDHTYENISEQALQIVGQFLERSDRCEHYEQLSANAIAHTYKFNNSQTANQLFDQIYTEAMN